MISGSVGWLWALGVFIIACVGLILSFNLFRAGKEVSKEKVEKLEKKPLPVPPPIEPSISTPRSEEKTFPGIPEHAKPVSPDTFPKREEKPSEGPTTPKAPEGSEGGESPKTPEGSGIGPFGM